jgi:hypothetical protein
MTWEIRRGARRSEKDDSGQMLCRIMPEQVANTVETGSRESVGPGLRFLVSRRRMDLRGDPPRTASFRGAIRQTSIPGQLNPKETPGIELLSRDRRGEASEDFQNASFGSFREVAAPQACGRNEIETAGSAAGEPPRLKPGTMNAESADPRGKRRLGNSRRSSGGGTRGLRRDLDQRLSSPALRCAAART